MADSTDGRETGIHIEKNTKTTDEIVYPAGCIEANRSGQASMGSMFQSRHESIEAMIDRREQRDSSLL